MNNERLLETFLDLAGTDSPSKQEAGVARYCERVLRELGMEVVIDDTAIETGSNTGNVIATLAGTAPGTLMLSAHMDCVDPAVGVVPIVENGIISTSSDTVLGGDDKVGIAAAIETVRTLIESGEPHPTIRLVFTVQEEVGLLGAKALDPKYLDCDLCLVLDADGEVGGTVIGAPFHHTFNATFTGRASHAGVAPEKGISAIAVAARAIDSMRIGRIDEHTTANIGTIKGGSADNVVAETCSISGECRSLVGEKAQATRDAMNKALRDAAEAFGATVDVEWVLEYDGFLYDEDSKEVMLVKKAAETLGLPAHTATSGGGSDANILAGKGVPVLVLAAGMLDIHSTKEKLAVSDLEKLTQLLVQIASNFDIAG